MICFIQYKHRHFKHIAGFSILAFLSLIKPDLNAQNQSDADSKIYEIDSVIIRARRESRDLMEKPYTEPNSLLPSISKLQRKDIIRTGAANVVEAMNYVPGALIETRGRQVKQFFSVRGQKYPYPDYAVNGVWQKEFEELPYFFSASDIEEIEIIRSSAALLTGLSGLTGLINIKMREYKTAETNIEMEYGSFNTLHSHLSNGNKLGSISYAFGLGYDRTSGPSGKHSGEEMTNFYSQVGWQPSDKLNVKANIFILNGEREMRIAELPADKRYRDMIQNFDPVKTILTNIKTIYRPTENLSSEIQLFYSGRNPTFNDEVKVTSSNEKDYEYGLNFIQSVKISNFNVLRFGGLYNHWVAPNGKRFYIGKRCDTETFSGVLVDEHRLGHFILDAGIRLTRTLLNDYGAFNIEGDGAQFRTVTPIVDEWEPAILQGSLGASYNAGGWFSVFFNAAAGQINPRKGTLDINLLVPLDEIRYKADLGVEGNFANSGKIRMTAFTVIQKNAITLSGESYLDSITNIRRELYLNRDQKQAGVELEIVSSRLFSIIQPFVNFTVMRSKMDENGSMVINRENPVLIAAGGVYADKGSFDFNFLAKYVSEFENDRFANPTDGPQKLGDFLTLDISEGYTTKGKIPVRFYLRSKNITNRIYSTVIGYPDFGRMIFAGIQIKFN